VGALVWQGALPETRLNRVSKPNPPGFIPNQGLQTARTSLGGCPRGGEVGKATNGRARLGWERGKAASRFEVSKRLEMGPVRRLSGSRPPRPRVELTVTRGGRARSMLEFAKTQLWEMMRWPHCASSSRLPTLSWIASVLSTRNAIRTRP